MTPPINSRRIWRCYLLLQVYLQIEAAESARWENAEWVLKRCWEQGDDGSACSFLRLFEAADLQGVCACVCDVCQGCVLIRETGVCPWAGAEGQENLVAWERSGRDKSGKPAKHPLPWRVDAL